MSSWKDSMQLAEDALNTSGNAMRNQEKYMESFNGKIQSISTGMETFWIHLFNSEAVGGFLDFINNAVELLNRFADATSSPIAGITAIATALAGIATFKGGGREKIGTIRKLIYLSKFKYINFLY